jgi:transcriptional regulator with PAS, ATPase and Fis domain
LEGAIREALLTSVDEIRAIALALDAPTLKRATQQFEAVYIRRAMERASRDRKAAARKMGIGYSTLKAKLRQGR